MMKRFLALAGVVAVAAVCFIGCGASPTSAPAEVAVTTIDPLLIGNWVRVDTSGNIYAYFNDTLRITTTTMVMGRAGSVTTYPRPSTSSDTYVAWASAGNFGEKDNTNTIWGMLNSFTYDYTLESGANGLLLMRDDLSSSVTTVTRATADVCWKKLP